jgi:hypothetical protein
VNARVVVEGGHLCWYGEDRTFCGGSVRLLRGNFSDEEVTCSRCKAEHVRQAIVLSGEAEWDDAIMESLEGELP